MKKLLCMIGLHKWVEKMDNINGSEYTGYRYYVRTCVRCDKKQMLTPESAFGGGWLTIREKK